MTTNCKVIENGLYDERKHKMDYNIHIIKSNERFEIEITSTDYEHNRRSDWFEKKTKRILKTKYIIIFKKTQLEGE